MSTTSDIVMQVNIYGTLRLVTGVKTLQMDLPAGGTLRDLLQEITRMYPAMQSELLDDQGEIRQDLPLFINGRNPRLFPGSIDTVLQPGDVLSMFSPVSSGRMNVEVLREAASGKRRDIDEG